MKKTLNALGALAMDILLSGERGYLDIGRRSRIIFLNSVTIAGGLMIALFAAISFASGNMALGTACVTASAIVFANLAAIRVAKRYAAGGVIDCAVIFVFYAYLAWSGGEAGSGILWSMTYPLIALFLLGPVWGTSVALAFAAALGVLLFTPAFNRAAFPALYSVRVIGTYLFIWLFSLIYELVRRATLGELQRSNGNLRRVTDELVGEKKQTDDILASVLEGIFLFGRDLKLGAAHSKHLEKLLECERIEGASLLDILASGLSERDLTATRDYFDLFFSGTVNEDLLAEINPLGEADFAFSRGNGVMAQKRIRFQFTRVASLDSPYPVMGVAVDVTDEYELKKKLETEEALHRRTMENLFQIIHVDPVMMREFIVDTDAELETVNDLMRAEESSDREVLEMLFQSAHAIKGNAALLGLQEFADKVHRYEDEVRKKLDADHAWRDLLELTLGLAEIKRELDGIKNLIEKILRFHTETQAAGLQDSSLLRYSIEKNVKRESARTGTPVSVQFSGFGRLCVPDEYRKLVKDIVVQFIRNSFAHAFEDGESRWKAGKKTEGTIALTLERTDAAVTLRYSDDGRGIDPERIRAAARLLPEYADTADGMNARQLTELIFRPGFSTAASATVGAGRGVGMTLVKRRIAEAGGRLAIRTAPGKYTEFMITLPIPEAARAVS